MKKRANCPNIGQLADQACGPGYSMAGPTDKNPVVENIDLYGEVRERIFLEDEDSEFHRTDRCGRPLIFHASKLPLPPTHTAKTMALHWHCINYYLRWPSPPPNPNPLIILLTQ